MPTCGQATDAGSPVRIHERREARPLAPDAATAGEETFVGVLRARADATPSRTAFTLLADGERASTTLTFAALDADVRAVAAALQGRSAPGDRALLLVSDHASFLRAFLGCLYAGAVAVPSHAVAGRSRDRLRALAHDAKPSVVLTTRAERERVGPFVAGVTEFDAAAWIYVDEITPDMADAWRIPAIGADTLAFLQYTSGSTGDPKGVMITHGNLMHNAVAMGGLLALHEDSVVASWLPVFHDMGLMGGVLQPLYAGATSVLMSATAFVQRPARWLEAIGRHKVTVTGAPNFAYDLCVDRVSAADRSSLDLRSWEVAVCAAEPISAKTLDRFTRAFAPCGFRPEVFSPAYGLAEATLVVTGTPPSEAPRVLSVDAERLRGGVAVTAVADAPARAVVASGVPMPGVTVAIVDPITVLEMPGGEVGEIWVSGGSVSAGYWGRPAMRDYTMAAHLAPHLADDSGFLRTGDLGFLAEGMLFVVGRHSDMIVVRGRNHAPQVVERTAERAHDVLAENSSAAFLGEIGGDERLVIVAEARRRKDLPDVAAVAAAVRAAVAEEHGLELHAFALLVPHALPRTTSGKVRRRDARAAWTAGTSSTIGSWNRATVRDSSSPVITRSAGAAPSSTVIEAWLVAHVAQLLGAHASEIDPHAPATTLGLGSQEAVATAGLLADWLGRPISATILFDGAPSLHSVAVELSGEPRASEEQRAPLQAIDTLPAQEARLFLRDLDRLSPDEIDALLRTVGSTEHDER